MRRNWIAGVDIFRPGHGPRNFVIHNTPNYIPRRSTQHPTILNKYSTVLQTISNGTAIARTLPYVSQIRFHGIPRYSKKYPSHPKHNPTQSHGTPNNIPRHPEQHPTVAQTISNGTPNYISRYSDHAHSIPNNVHGTPRYSKQCPRYPTVLAMPASSFLTPHDKVLNHLLTARRHIYIYIYIYIYLSAPALCAAGRE